MAYWSGFVLDQNVSRMQFGFSNASKHYVLDQQLIIDWLLISCTLLNWLLTDYLISSSLLNWLLNDCLIISSLLNWRLTIDLKQFIDYWLIDWQYFLKLIIDWLLTISSFLNWFWLTTGKQFVVKLVIDWLWIICSFLDLIIDWESTSVSSSVLNWLFTDYWWLYQLSTDDGVVEEKLIIDWLLLTDD